MSTFTDKSLIDDENPMDRHTLHFTHFVVELLLEGGCKVCGHLSDGVTGGVADPGVLRIHRAAEHGWASASCCISNMAVLTGSEQNSKTKLTISWRMASICWWQPSPMADSAISPAWRYFQSAGDKHTRSSHVQTNQPASHVYSFI